MLGRYNHPHFAKISMKNNRFGCLNWSFKITWKQKISVGGNIIWYSHCMEYSMVVPQKIKCGITVWSRHLTTGDICKRIESRDLKRYLYICVHSRIPHNNQKAETTQMSGEWRSKTWNTHTMEYYSAIKRKEMLTPATTWMNLEDIMINEISQSQTNTVGFLQ